MRFTFDIALDEPILPLDYRRKILSLFKAALSDYENGKYFEQSYGNNAVRKFTFAPILPKPVFGQDSIQLGMPGIKVVFSTTDKGEGIIFFNALLNKKNITVKVGERKFKLVSIRLLQDPIIKSNSADFKISSPICLRQHDKETNSDYYISVANDEFVIMLKEALIWQLQQYKPSLVKYVEDLMVDCTTCRKTVVMHYGQYVESTIGTISLCGEPALLNAIAKMGLGVRKASGFGLLNLVKQEEVIE